MAVMDVSRQRRSLLDDATVINHLPAELLDIIKDHTSPKILDAVSEAALSPRLTERIFTHFEPAFADICARWVLNLGDLGRTLMVSSALAKILPFAPHLATFLEHERRPEESALLGHGAPSPVRLLLPDADKLLHQLDEQALLSHLVTLWRLISFDQRRFGGSISPALAQKLFSCQSRPVRYLAVRIFCQLLRTSEVKLEALIDRHVGAQEPILADLDGVTVDFGFLTLHEQRRVENSLLLHESSGKTERPEEVEPLNQTLTPYVAAYGKVLLPCPAGRTGDPPSLIMTPTTTTNLERLARMIHNDEPVLLHGLPGSGKTSLVHEVAKELGMYSSMVTLHLNEQTDAKMLVGLYSTDSKPGSFQWRAGVLTTAVKEGRWVLVEDLDRAPTEVLSTLLPLIERKELLVPSRGETIRAAKSFRLFATVRTTRGMNGQENLPTIVGMRFWQSMHTEPLTEPELEDVIVHQFPILQKYVPGIMAVYKRLSGLGQHPTQMAGSRSLVDRRLNLRDLLKWCHRLRETLSLAGAVSGAEAISESTRDWMFMDALDCFVGSCPDAALSRKLAAAIAQEMHIAAERAEHYATAHTPPMEETEQKFTIGRVRLSKQRASDRVQKSKRPFASTSHARKLLEQIAVAVKLREPVLLVGETGIGKTTVVQQLAESLGHKLIAVNLSQQSEVGDLLGGFKPVNVRTLAVPLKEEFEDLFAATGISFSKNQKYIEQVGKCFAKGQWSKVSKLWKEAPKMFIKIVSELERAHALQEEARNGDDDGQPAKRRKTQSKLQMLLNLRPRWDLFSQKLEQFEIQVSSGGNTFAFSFMEGNLVKAVRNGDWVLLDEINLASPDTLESIVDLLTGPDERPSILLSETGEIEKVVAHPNFRIFGAMNPATDIGKRDLPAGIRSRFTELYVHSPDNDVKDLLTIIKAYLGSTSSKHDKAADDVARLYLNTKRLANDRRLVDGANEVPHFSLRTLTRVLSYVNTIAPSYGLRRALYEGFSMGFLTLLNRESEAMLVPLIHHHLFEAHGNAQSLLSQAPKHPNDGTEYVRFKNKAGDRQYWLFQGREPVVQRDDYIITPSVERNLLNLVRATSTRRFPILIQGPTSAGKTSMIEYLSNFTGNKFVRINNHEHTDLQEYLGTYVSGADGKLRFQEGLLVQAMRQGHWIVLDELNLAPTDVLEALNRLLDDNRELLIPETQEIVRPHENFILFATQNPPGLYGGRKVLSRAFRNRFLELHFDDIPEDELEYILQHRSRNTSPPDCRRIVTVYKELSRLRQTTRVFEKKDSFATLRDLFRWALREAESREEIAIHGFMLLAERVRNEEERLAVKEVIEKVFKVTLDPQTLYSASVAPELSAFSQQINGQGVVWTHAMRRLYVLVSRALQNNEPVLLVGETGCGKTTVCQLLAEALQQQLHIVNAHQNTETGDLIGSQRPVRNRGAIVDALNHDLGLALQAVGQDVAGSVEDRLQRYKALDKDQLSMIQPDLRLQIESNQVRSKALFEWSDGALVEAMRGGHLFLLDEISLADDSVLERLNSVLEPQRTLLLAEKGIDNSFVTAAPGFQMFATMNPGGDFGKKELSPALRNRFTEIWVPGLSETEDIHIIVRSKLVDACKDMTDVVVRFASWFGATFRSMASTPFSIRELLAWVHFINNFHTTDRLAALVHGASTIFIDSIGANPSAIFAVDPESISQQRLKCLEKLHELTGQDVSTMYQTHPELSLTDAALSIGDFSIPRTAQGLSDPGFAFHAPTTRLNGMRILRALQMQKPVLLEGSPGVGKTTLVAAIARVCGQPLTRINLSDQTDLMDLFGTDVPVEGAEAGNFAWRDAPFLQAMQKGEWVLLDEMNLASQSVLEGLNACLDHRGEVYISELDQVFKRHPDFRLFAAQNPHHQGGGRKGLPSSFVNRFVVVYADVLTENDLERIAAHNFPHVPSQAISQLIQFIAKMDHALVKQKTFGAQGGPWEFNLRDVLRWLHLLSSSEGLLQDTRIDDFLGIIVKQRFRTQRDRDEVDKLFAEVTGFAPRPHSLYQNTTPTASQVGLALLERNPDRQPERMPSIDTTPRLAELETLMICVKKNIPCILSSPSGHGKSILLQHLAALAGKPLVVFPMNADVDTMDLVGGFEQADPLREANATLMTLRDSLQTSVTQLIPEAVPTEALRLLHLLDEASVTPEGIASIRTSVESLAGSIPADSAVGQLLATTLELLSHPLSLENPRFEWLDGIIIKALQSGQWLVLDNANMCNASVLDRLNSLLEPDGFLSINEHCEPGGAPRIIRPHPDFRIFLTVDPRYGELSRAMRNRAVEVYISEPPPAVSPSLGRVAQVESSLHRLLMLQAIPSVKGDASRYDLARLGIDQMTVHDLIALNRFVTNQDSSTSVGSEEVLQSTTDTLTYLQTPWALDTISSISTLYHSIVESSQSLTGDQPIHPLSNFLFTRLARSSEQPFWLAMCLELSCRFHQILRHVDSHRKLAQITKLSSLNRLQRSLVGDRVAAVNKDSTVKLASFLSSVSTMMLDYIRGQVAVSENWKALSKFLKFVAHYLERTLSLSACSTFDEARFSAHLTLGTKLFKSLAEDGSNLPALADDVISRISGDFDLGFRLSTGLSMELLWLKLRPTPVHDETAFTNCLELERLGARFDILRWRTSTPITDLCKAAETLEKAYYIVKTANIPATELVQSLGEEITSLEGRIGIESREVVPHFSDVFERLRGIHQLKHALSHQSSPDREIVLLSNLPTQEVMHSETGAGGMLSTAANLACQDQYAWDGRLASSMWSGLQGSGNLSLGSLALLEVELPILGRQVANYTADINADALANLNDMLWHMTLDVLGAHQTELVDLVKHARASVSDVLAAGHLESSQLETKAVVELLASIEASHLCDVTKKHILPAMVALARSKLDSAQQTQQTQLSAIAWCHFSVAMLLLYVPDRVFDPQIRPQVEREFFEILHTNLDREILTLETFEKWLMGQTSSVRIGLLREEAAQLDPLPEVAQLVYRPEQSELGRLHAEFANVLKAVNAVVATLDEGIQPDIDNGLHLVRENVQRLISRLSSRFEAYQDMTIPAIHLLRSLLVGLSLCDAISSRHLSTPTRQLVRVTPFMGGLWDPSLPGITPDSFEFLHLAGLATSVQGLDALPQSTVKQAIFECFHSFYDDWNKKLEADRKAQQENTSLYRFRGSAEDEEEIDAEEFNELFPTFDEEEEGDDGHDAALPRPIKNKDQVRDTSIKVAQAHRRIFLSPREPVSAIADMCTSLSSRLAKEVQDAPYVDRDITRTLLPSTVLLLADKAEKLASTAVDKSYNFYVDENLPEARLLVTLANKVKARFRELQGVDEIGHMQPLADVVASCDRLLEIVHQEPLAKMMPKLEQLHAHVYEWQFGGWASRVHAVPELHTALTDTVIRWRRLELTTWANLFETERQKCKDDAFSWWFIAYQVVIAVPLTMVDGGTPGELRDYAVSLTETLESYFSSSILGQFSSRIALLSQLRNHLRHLMREYPTLECVYESLASFISYYVRYEKVVEDTIQKGRAPLDKKMKDVLLLASWKDTNITALRESARKSHQKLFRLVRKFRAVLGQDMRIITSQGLPDQDHAAAAIHEQRSTQDSTSNQEAAAEAAAQVEGALPDWLNQHKRLANGPKTVSIMAKIAQSPALTSGLAATLEEFISSLDTSMEELRKETPSFLTEENKTLVKHLKTRKRKLFADTLRDLRQMGVRYNLGQDQLAEQKSLAVVLSSLPSSTTETVNPAMSAADYFLHKILDIVPKVRDSARDHSEDLTGPEMARSIGFVEGLLHMLLGQRRRIIAAHQSAAHLQRRVSQLRSVCSTEAGRFVRVEEVTNLPHMLPWLSSVIDFSIHLIEMHARLGGNKDYASVTGQLKSWSARFAEHQAFLKATDVGLQHVTTLTRSEREAAIKADLDGFIAYLDDTTRESPNLEFALREVKLWSLAETAAPEAGTLHDTQVRIFADSVSTLCDRALVAIEHAKKAALSIMPQDDEKAGWLTKHTDTFFNVVKKLRLDEVTHHMDQCFRLLEQVDVSDPQSSAACKALLSLASPILHQFFSLGQHVVDQVQQMHRAAARMAFYLTNIFLQISSKGFCTPQEKSDDKAEEGGNLESGTGLGEGEGAEDISKDIQPDEDMTELAQEANKEKKDGETEDEKDAVDMADEELEGDLGSAAGDDDEEQDGSDKGDDDKEDDDMDEETGDVDDLDPTAVDEKMWDGEDEDQADKDQQGDKPMGQKNEDEQMAAEEQGQASDEKHDQADDKDDPDQEQQQQPEPDAEEAEDEKEDVNAQEDLNKQEQTAEEQETLALPDEMDLDLGEEQEVSDSDDLDLASDGDDNDREDPDGKAEKEEEEEEQTGQDETDQQEQQANEPDSLEMHEEEDPEPEVEDEVRGPEEVQEDVQEEEEEEGKKEDESEDQPVDHDDKAMADKNNAAPSDVKSGGQDQTMDDAMELDDNNDDDFKDNAAQQEDGEMGQGAADKQAAAGSKGSLSKETDQIDNSDQQEEQRQEDEDAESSAPFRRLGDALEKWHRQQADIQDASAEDDDAANKNEEHKADDEDVGKREFQHLQDDEAAADTQAMGAAKEEEVKPIDEAMAIDEEAKDPSSRVMEPDEDESKDPTKDEMADDEQEEDGEDKDKDRDRPQDQDVRSGVQTRQGKTDIKEDESADEDEDMHVGREEEEEEEDDSIEETSTQLSTTHISPTQPEERELRDAVECAQQWADFQSRTQAHSLSLTSQLRLILTPSQSTKLSGAFRTGKRLNIKRIIPYIASSYKRDKIWMRRAVPTKRTYQILLCVDDSRSMGESDSGKLAMESLVMVSRSLTMLEAGQVGVVGFGADVFTAHPLTETFGADAGGKVLQNFSFAQDRTDVALLVRRTIDAFKAARQQQSSGGAGDLWQLSLILSDGLTPSSAHDGIRRLLREAAEERIMIVFIIMDDTARKRNKGDSVLELKEAKFISEGGESRVVIERYLDTFPFPYYLIVHDLEELPSALAGLLRTWFAEVNA